jgi:hypothetical protein
MAETRRQRLIDRNSALIANSTNPFAHKTTKSRPVAASISANAKATLKAICAKPLVVQATRQAAQGDDAVGIGRTYFAGAYYVTPAPMELDRALTKMMINAEAPSERGQQRNHSSLTPPQRLLLERAATAKLRAQSDGQQPM